MEKRIPWLADVFRVETMTDNVEIFRAYRPAILTINETSMTRQNRAAA
jgi:hypothetical protein